MKKFFRHPWIVVAVTAAITVFFAAQLPRAQLDNNNFRFVPDDDPERLAAVKIGETFGSQMMILVGLERKYGTVLEPDFLAKLRAYVERVKTIPQVNSIQSMITSDYIIGIGDTIVIEPLVPEDFSGSRAQIAELKDRLLSWDLYRHSLVSDDFRSTQVMVYLDILSEDAGSPKTMAVYRNVKSAAKEAGFPGTEIYLTGLPVFSSVINEAMLEDLVFLVPLVILVVLAVLFLSFRRAGGIILPLLTVIVSAIWALGAMPLVGIKLSILSTILPVILVAVGSAYGIHVISHYYDEMAGKKDLGPEGHRELVFEVLRKIGWPVFLAALTTFAGFVSFCFTPAVPIFEFGIFSSFGVLAAFVVSVTLIPALLILRGPARKIPRFRITEIESGSEDPLSRSLADALCALSRKRRTVLGVAALVALASCFGVSRLVIDNVLVEYFKPDTEIARSDRFIREFFGGSKTVNVVVSSPIPGEVLRPDVLAALDGLARHLAAYVPEVGKTAGFTDLVKRMNQVLNADEPSEGLRSRSAPESPAGAEPGFGFSAEPPDGAPGETIPAFGFSAEPPGGAPMDTAAADGSAAAAAAGQPGTEPLDAASDGGADQGRQVGEPLTQHDRGRAC